MPRSTGSSARACSPLASDQEPRFEQGVHDASIASSRLASAPSMMRAEPSTTYGAALKWPVMNPKGAV
jgi:hypothetical protein